VEFLGPAGGLCEFLSDGSKKWGPPSLDFGEGREGAALASIVVVRADRAEGNHWSTCLGKRVSGGGRH